jgi:DNA primase
LAGRIPDRTVRDIVEQTDMKSIVGEVVELRRAGTSLKGLCPFHNEKTPSFHINEHRKLYHCYGCGAGGDVIRFVSETRGLSFVEAVEYLGDRVGIQVEREETTPEEIQRALAERSQRGRMLELYQAAQAFFRHTLGLPDGAEARKYAQDRGLSPEIFERFGLGAAGRNWEDLVQHLHRRGFAQQEIVASGLGMPRDSGGLYDRFRDRLMFPIHTSSGDLVGFGGRSLGGGKEVAKYMNTPETTLDTEAPESRFRHFYKKGQCVFGLHQARASLRQTHTAIIVEGNLDVMTLHQAGLESTVCAMGTALTEMQVKEIKRFANKVVLVFDGDAAGRKAAMKAVPVCVAEGFDGVFVLLPETEDPDSYVRKFGAKAMQDLIQAAPNLVTGYIDALVTESDGSLQAKAEVVQKAGLLLAAIPNPIVRDMARDHLASRLLDRGTDENRATLQRYLQRIVPAAPVAESGEMPIPDPTRDEPPVPTIEADLARILVWYPGLMGQAQQFGALEYLGHDGVRLALRDLLGRGRESGLDATVIAEWAREMPDGHARRLILRSLMEGAPAPADQANPWLTQVVLRLQERRLDEEIDAVRGALVHTGSPEDQLAALSQRLVRLKQEKEHVRVALRRAGQPV